MTDQVGFIGTQRVDGKLILPEAMQVMALGNSKCGKENQQAGMLNFAGY